LNAEILADLSLRMVGTIVPPRARGVSPLHAWDTGAMVRQLRPGCSIPADCGETRTLASVLRVTTHAAGSDCLNWHGRGPVHLSCAPQPAICPFCDFAPGVAGDAPQRLCMGTFAPSSCSMLLVTRYIQVQVYTCTGAFGVACEAQRVRSMQNNSSAVYFLQGWVGQEFDFFFSVRRAGQPRAFVVSADCRPVMFGGTGLYNLYIGQGNTDSVHA
jgi:hypothetical protein